MPELPEVETIRSDVDREFVGQCIVGVEVRGLRSVRRHVDPAEFVSRVERRRLLSTRRRGKYLLLNLDKGNVVVAHMGMSGQLLRAQQSESMSKHTHVVLTFAGGTQLRFVDPRTFGELFVTTPDRLEEEVPELAHLGLDPLAGGLTRTGLARLLAARRTKLKPLLMDQRFLAGIGNMYADEILFAAGLRFDRSPDGLSRPEVRRLYGAIVETLRSAIAHRGSSLADEQYRDLFGHIGNFQRLHNVYDHEGNPCPRCGTAIARIKANGRSTFFCPHCQV